MQNLKFSKTIVTPIMAKKFLEQNIDNRRANTPKVSRYCMDMIQGKWKEDTGETIKFSKTGRLLDGQNRLLAVVKSNCAIPFHIAYNVDEKVFDVLDTGKSRNASDCFTIAKIKHHNTLPSIIAYFNLLEEGKKRGQQANTKATNAELLEQYFKDEEFWQYIARTTFNYYLSFGKILPPSCIGGFYAHFFNLEDVQADLFMNQLCTGSNIQNQVINLLRNKLMQDIKSTRKMTTTLKMALIIKAWNHYVNNTHVKILKFDSIHEDFPVAIKRAETPLFNDFKHTKNATN